MTARPSPPRKAPPLAAMLLPLFATLTLASLTAEAGLRVDSKLTWPRPVPEGPAPEVPPPPTPSSLNLTFDPGTWTLTWLCSSDITVTSCYVNFTLHGRPTRRRMQVGIRARGDVIRSRRGGAPSDIIPLQSFGDSR